MRNFTTPIQKITDINPEVKSFYFDKKITANPGQFVMMCIPGIGDKPFSLGNCTDSGFFLTIKKVGDFTEKLFEMSPGTMVRIRGPLGSSFSTESKNALLIGGGYGIPPLSFLTARLKANGSKITVINGARSACHLVSDENLENLADRVFFTTDDGSRGRKGFTTTVVSELLENENFDMIYSAGPELMMKRVAEIAESKNINYELCLERYMKCGVGICGSCVMDPEGLILCKEGTVLNRSKIRKLTEFGQYHRNAAGERIQY